MKKLNIGQRVWYYNGQSMPKIVTITGVSIYNDNFYHFAPEVAGEKYCGEYRLFDNKTDVITEIERDIRVLEYCKTEMSNAEEINHGN